MNFDNPQLVSEMERKAYLAGDTVTIELLDELTKTHTTIDDYNEAFDILNMDPTNYLISDHIKDQANTFMEERRSYQAALYAIRQIIQNGDSDALEGIGTIIKKVDLGDYECGY